MIATRLGWALFWAGLAAGAAAQQQVSDDLAPTAAGQSAPASLASGPGRAPPWSLQVQAPGELGDLLRNYLDLARYHDEVTKGEAKGGIGAISRGELRRLVAAAPEQARSLLEAEGYFSADIRTDVVDEGADQPIVIHLQVIPGPRTRVRQVQMVFEGELDTRLGKDDPDAKRLVEDLDESWALPEGAIFRQSEWSASKTGMLARMRARGYPLATLSGAAATVDAQALGAKLYVVADSGPLFHFGDVYVEGLKAHDASAVLNLAPFNKGDPYSEQSLLDFQERVQKLNLFDNVFVTMDNDAAIAEGAPVTVQVRELPLQQATVGVGVSSDNGPRVSVEHLHRRFLGAAWQAKSKLQVAQKESSFESDLTSHPLPGRRRWLAAVAWSRLLDDDDSVTTSQRLRFGQGQEGERLERTRYVEYQRAEVRSDEGLKVSEASALSGTQQWIWRNVDNQVLPTEGITVLGEGTVGRSFATLESSGFFGRAYGRGTWYKPLPAGWLSTSRVELGRVLARAVVSVPDTLLFKAGGDESVRGYDYRSLGVMRDGVVVGGRALVTVSGEVAHPIVAKYPNVLGALFVDAGDAADNFSDISLHVGYGVGLRWRSPVGPLKLDLAHGEEGSVRVHFSVGISL